MSAFKGSKKNKTLEAHNNTVSGTGCSVFYLYKSVYFKSAIISTHSN